MKIRDATAEDLPEIVRIYNQAVAGGVATFDLEPVTLEQRREWFRQFGPENPILVADEGNGLSGFAYYLPYRAKAAYARTKETTIYVDEARHGRGVGSALYEALIARAVEGGVHVLLGVIGGDNPPSVALHKKFGFELVGRLHQVGRKFDEWVDTQFFQKTL